MKNLTQSGQCWEDNSFAVWQRDCGTDFSDKLLRFGPLSATITELFSAGWFICGSGFLHNRTVTMRLHHAERKDHYKLFKFPVSRSLFTETDFCRYIRDGAQMIHMVSENKVDPMVELQMKYPVAKRQMIGNQTISEYLQ